MKLMKVVLFGIAVSSMVLLNTGANAQFWKKKKTRSKKVVTQRDTVKKDKTVASYKKLLKGAETKKGMFNIHKKEDKIYLEIPKNLMDNTFMLTSRVTAVSDNYNTTSGRMVKKPVMISFSTDNKKVYVYMNNYKKKVAENSDLKESFDRNNLEPIWFAYKIDAFGKDSASCVIDVTNIFFSGLSHVSPFEPAGGLGMFTKKGSKGSLDKNRSKILSVKAFDNNVNVKCRMAYSVLGHPYTVEMSRNIVMLKKNPMRVRYADLRVGYFENGYTLFDDKKEGSEKQYMIHRWDLQAKPEDIERHKNGELVEPANPIVWYVDSAIPAKWRGYVKAGIEDWQKAFEKIGFKNAIVAKEYPKNDPNFDPDDVTYNCYRFVTCNIKNSMGPSWYDPRSGEILGADVMFYSDVTKLIHNWRMVQTATVDPAARKKVFSDKMMGESLRYVAAHEIGHTLGLMHNFGASSAFPVDSLRSPKFTQKYGTAPSIMDYARYNYVAQPGDLERGVKLTPPDLGVYDIYAIKWGYKPIYSAKTAEDEKETLNKWIIEKSNDPMYHYGKQVSRKEVLDPADQSEDLSDDVVKATEYGIRNLKLLVKNLEKWTLEEYDGYEYYNEIHKEIATQFYRYMKHMMSHVAGATKNDIVYGDNQTSFKFLPREKQKRVVKALLKNIYEFPLWFTNENTKKVNAKIITNVITMQAKLMHGLCNGNVMSRLNLFEQLDAKNAYTYREYSDDLFNFVWKKSLRGQNLTINDRNIQTLYVGRFMVGLGSDKDLASAFNSGSKLTNDLNVTDEEISASSAGTTTILQTLGSPVNYKQLKRVHSLLKRLKNTGNRATRDHYETLFFKVDRFLN